MLSRIKDWFTRTFGTFGWVLLWLLSVLVAAYGIVCFTGGTLPTINIPAIFATPAPTATPKPTPTPAPRVAIPYDGRYFGHSTDARLEHNRTSEITITTPAGASSYYCIVLVEADNPSNKICSIFMYSGKTVTIDVPAEKALVYYTSAPYGSYWYGSDLYFADNGSWSTSDDVFDFSEYTWSITLQKVANGNWDTDPINAKNVPFLN